jgi:hypothetical protein
MAIVNGECTAVLVLHMLFVYVSLVAALLHAAARDGDYIKEKTHDAVVVVLLYAAVSVVIFAITTVIIAANHDFSGSPFFVHTPRELYLVNMSPLVIRFKGIIQWIMLGFVARALLV